MLTNCTSTKSTTIESPQNAYTIHYIMMMECKISQAMTPHIQVISEKYQQSNQLLFVAHFPETFVHDNSNLQKWKKDYGLSLKCEIDSLDLQTQALNASRAPQAIIVDESNSQIVYSGRINNLFAALGKKRPQVTDHTLDDAIQQILNGKAVNPRTTEVVGCALN